MILDYTTRRDQIRGRERKRGVAGADEEGGGRGRGSRRSSGREKGRDTEGVMGGRQNMKESRDDMNDK